MTTATTKRECPITRTQFRAAARAAQAQIGGQPFVLNPKEFKSGSFGFHGHGKIGIKFGETVVPCQVNVLVTAIGSAEAGE